MSSEMHTAGRPGSVSDSVSDTYPVRFFVLDALWFEIKRFMGADNKVLFFEDTVRFLEGAEVVVLFEFDGTVSFSFFSRKTQPRI